MTWPWRMPVQAPWGTPYPLPRDTAETVLAQGHCDNFALLLERYLAFGDNRGQVQLLRELNDRRGLVPDFTPLRELIEACHARRQRLAEDLGAITFSARPEWRVIVGLGNNDVLGSGISLHPTFGFPIVPASSLKGVCHTYAQRVLDRPVEELELLFGKGGENGERRGDLLFLDGIPAAVPVVERDVVSPIWGDYYRNGGTPPASYLSSRPSFFLAVGAASRYSFAVGSISGNAETAQQGAAWLREALVESGVGAKSAAGYGYWVIE
jgi:CRISPR-associated protein Cmr6